MAAFVNAKANMFDVGRSGRVLQLNLDQSFSIALTGIFFAEDPALATNYRNTINGFTNALDDHLKVHTKFIHCFLIAISRAFNSKQISLVQPRAAYSAHLLPCRVKNKQEMRMQYFDSYFLHQLRFQFDALRCRHVRRAAS